MGSGAPLQLVVLALANLFQVLVLYSSHLPDRLAVVPTLSASLSQPR